MSSQMYKKLSKTLINDKKVNTFQLSKLISGEFYKLLQEYAEVLPETTINFDLDESGVYELSYTAKLKRIKTLSFLD